MAGTTTGQAPLPDIGTLTYNGVAFSSLYTSRLEGTVAKDDSGRTTKNMDWTLTVDGLVTLEGGLKSTDATWTALRQKLTAPAKTLQYKNKGFGTLNVGGPYAPDVAWGPIPEILHFQPLGASPGDGTKSAKIVWRVTTRIPEFQNFTPPNPPGISGPVLQFNYEYNLTYDERGYVGAVFRGTLEIPLSRNPVNPRLLNRTVDDFRKQWMNLAFDLTKYKVVDRDFQESRDKRKCEWTYRIQQLTPGGLPVGSMKARGRMTVKQLPPGGAKPGVLLASPRWGCSLTCTYTLRPDVPRRVAMFSFMALLWFRMWSSAFNARLPDSNVKNLQQVRFQAAQNFGKSLINQPDPPPPSGPTGIQDFYTALQRNMQAAGGPITNWLKQNPDTLGPMTPLLTDFSIDEGLYEDSDTITFQAGWVMMTNFQNLVAASGLWRYNQDTGGRAWGVSVSDVVGWRGALKAMVDPAAEVIVDMGGGEPILGKGPLVLE